MGHGQSLPSSARYEQLGFGTGTGTAVAASGSANVKGSYASIGGATSFDYDGLYISGITGSGSKERFLVDIAANNGGGDEIIIANYFYESAGNNSPIQPVIL